MAAPHITACYPLVICIGVRKLVVRHQLERGGGRPGGVPGTIRPSPHVFARGHSCRAVDFGQHAIAEAARQDDGPRHHVKNDDQSTRAPFVIYGRDLKRSRLTYADRELRPKTKRRATTTRLPIRAIVKLIVPYIFAVETIGYFNKMININSC